ncbi:ergothioneine biosynthesis protein EgtB [Croceibacterium sp. LX-88]|uniref:Ergothioneine biosynthesis protein EgtB n=1 Tax=Croceibacterium selenioxidans TaxID=2838833 RepID=A0ABS5W2B8_9SPHN|nr:ergothioneine biosynthesis protein EgtB [Croceibacterium selenioxidans]MBT2133272.1 ergothioneine biosynthesis protein EgtB [Croceibacterium selenioxidans]
MPEAQRQRTTAAPDLISRYAATRRLSEALVEPLSEADATIQSMPDASPAKWHLAHTTWFFETFLLRDRLPSYRLFDDRWPFLFNSYYEGEGERILRPRRGMLSRPTLREILDWRVHVDESMQALLGDTAHASLIELGIAHEQQHQELLLTDIKHALFQNPLGPAMWTAPLTETIAAEALPDWYEHPGGIALIGQGDGGFAFDNEGPPHRVLLEPFGLAGKLVTNGDWQAFIDDGGYRAASLWLSDGWDWVRREQIGAPLYWKDGEHFTHAGWQPRPSEAPVCHISYYEADAFASWAGARLPTEFEWEAIGQSHDPSGGNQFDTAAPPLPTGSAGLFGDCWQFTRSAYLPYPRFAPAEGAVGEYNGKFMAGQWVLKGASCATVRGHSRASYRNFFYPQQRWQFTGLRLAKDL